VNFFQRTEPLFRWEVLPDSQGRSPSLKVLYTTGYTRDAIVHNGVLDADVQLISKPFTLEQLANKVMELCDSPRK
jgi:hypothetical protein